MKYGELLALARDLPIIETRVLRTMAASQAGLSVQLSRWVSAGKLLQLRRGLYLLPEELRHHEPPRAYVANLLVTPSYVSLHTALEHHGLIPEAVHLVQSITTARPGSYQTPLGTFRYQHVKQELFFGYREYPVADGSAMIAQPEKALLDLVYLTRGEPSRPWIEGLRLQNLDQLDLERLQEMAQRSQDPKLRRAAQRLGTHVTEQLSGEITL